MKIMKLFWNFYLGTRALAVKGGGCRQRAEQKESVNTCETALSRAWSVCHRWRNRHGHWCQLRAKQSGPEWKFSVNFSSWTNDLYITNIWKTYLYNPLQCLSNSLQNFRDDPATTAEFFEANATWMQVSRPGAVGSLSHSYSPCRSLWYVAM